FLVTGGAEPVAAVGVRLSDFVLVIVVADGCLAYLAMIVIPYSLDQFILHRVIRLTGIEAHSTAGAGDQSGAPLPCGELPGRAADTFELSAEELGVFHGGITTVHLDPG